MADGRLTNQEIAEQVSLSPLPCLRRLRRLEKAGIIRQYVG
jgi:Lrp/AsnC family leucine-responsive transcriptional regulator